ncbi:MAG: hypothetical protein K6A82_00350 [Prevotella sp.]|nr:hypothetical protein [Prevotella sp.]
MHYYFSRLFCETENYIALWHGDHFWATVSNTYNQHNDKLETSRITARHGGDPADFTMRYNYDDLGRLKEVIRPVGSGDEGKMTYSYDLHGWTTGITTNSFREQLHYADGVGVPCYNGNISSQLWQHRDDAQQRGYRFTYDGLNRLTNAAYGETESLTNAAGKYDERMTYDADGNILTLRRSGLKQDGQYGLIDDLTMTYDGPQLSQVQEKAAAVLRNGSFDFKGTRSDYQYNGNGSLVRDTGKGITLIEYDDNNMPRRIQFTNDNVTEYVFTATGRKLRTVHYTTVLNIEVGS